MVSARAGAPSVSSMQHDGRLQALGAVHGEQAHAPAAADSAGARMPPALSARTKRIRRGVARAVDLQRRAQQRAQVGQHACRATAPGAAAREAGQHVALRGRSRPARRAAAGGPASAFQSRSVAAACAQAGRAGPRLACSSSNHGRGRPVGRAAPRRNGQRDQRVVAAGRTAATSAPAPATGRASGDTSTSSSATMSCTSGASHRSVFSGCCAGMCSARSSSSIAASRSRLRASTMMSPRRDARRELRGDPARRPAGIPARRVFPRAARAARSGCRASASAASASAVLGARRVARDRRQAGHARRPRGIRWCAARKPSYWPAACACAITSLTAAITAGALRWVWSQLSRSPSRPSTMKSCAARNTCGSARRKR